MKNYFDGKISRREFLKKTLAAFLAVCAGWILPGLRERNKPPAFKPGPGTRPGRFYKPWAG